MKTGTLLTLILGLAASAFAQGTIWLANFENNNPSPTATANGLFFVCQGTYAVLINQDFNVSFYGGSDVNSLSLLKTFVGPSAAGDNAAGPGTFIDLSGMSITVPGATNTAFFRIDAWLFGADYNTAGLRGTSGVFGNPLGNPLASPPETPARLVGMPAVIIGFPEPCPEPGSLTLAGLGAAALLVFRPRRTHSPTPRHRVF